jgi:hypothetical protein
MIKYLFCINTGRSGSNYLQVIFDHVEGCRSFHEPPPVCNGREMREFLRGDEAVMRELTEQKFRSIETLRGKHPVYFESNHCFIKGFGWFLPDHIPQEEMGVLLLRREPQQVVESYHRLETTPYTQLGQDWIITPNKKEPLVTPPSVGGYPRATLHGIGLLRKIATGMTYRLLRHRDPLSRWVAQYEKNCLAWYIEETFAMAQRYLARFNRIRSYEISLPELNDIAAVQRMLTAFDLAAKPSLASVLGRPVNEKRE